MHETSRPAASTPILAAPRLAVSILPVCLLAALLLQGCGDQSGEQVAEGSGEPIDMPATPEEIEKLDAVVERFPEVKPLADQARADGIITEFEIIEVLEEAEGVKAARDAE